MLKTKAFCDIQEQIIVLHNEKCLENFKYTIYLNEELTLEFFLNVSLNSIQWQKYLT